MTSTPLPGDELKDRVLGGRYRVTRLLGRGGMGAVWVARDQQTGAEVAVKLIKASLLDDPAALQRFRREMRVMAGLSHENIVRGVDAGEDEGVLWLAMELIAGQTLRERLDARGRMPWQDSLGVVRQIARGLGAAHQAGVVHRDLKPENIMIVPGEDGAVHVKLLDFGVAKASHADGGQSSMTGTGFIVGTPGYVAPEVVLEGKTNDPRTDFYALGVVWYEMLTGQKPFTAKTAFALAMRHAHERPPTFNEVAPFAPVPAPVESIVLRLMGKSPEERPPDAAALLVLVDGLERGAAAAAAGTPLPDAFDATLTDVRETPNGTAVVPIKLAPTPGHRGPATPTPATGLAPSSSERAPSDLHLFRTLPARLKVLLIAGAVALPLTTLAVIAAAVRGPPAVDGAGPTDRGPEARSGSGQPMVAAAPPIAAVQPEGEQGALAAKANPAPAREGGILEAKEADLQQAVRSPEGADPRLELADRRTHADRKAKRDAPTPPAPPVAPAAPGFGTWTLTAQGFDVDVDVELDGKAHGDPPIKDALLPTGEHTVRFLDSKTGALVLERTFTVTPTEPYELHLKPGER